MYTAIFSLAAAVTACISIMFYGTDVVMAGGFVIVAMAIGFAADKTRKKRHVPANDD